MTIGGIARTIGTISVLVLVAIFCFSENQGNAKAIGVKADDKCADLTNALKPVELDASGIHNSQAQAFLNRCRSK